MNFKTLYEKVKSIKRKKIAVAGAEKDEIIKACIMAYQSNIVDFILVGEKSKIESTISSISPENFKYEIINVKDDKEKAIKSCELYKNGEIDLIMKGSVSTGTLLKQVLDKKYNLRGSGFLSHIAVIEWTEDRIIGITDGGLNIAPTLEDKILIIKNAIEFFNKIGIQEPKVALVSAVEVPNPKMESTIEFSIISKMADRGAFKNGIVDGPFGFDNAIDRRAAEIKGIKSPVAGDADIIVAPDIEAANMCAKGIIYASSKKNGGVVIGSTSPIILLSRADTAETKFNSIILALASLE